MHRPCGTPGCVKRDHHAGPCSTEEAPTKRHCPRAEPATPVPARLPHGKVPKGRKSASTSAASKKALGKRRQQPAAAPSTEEGGEEPLLPRPRLLMGSEGGPIGRRSVPVGKAHQVTSLPPELVPSLQPPPASPPHCHCRTPCVWLRGRWFCAGDTCGFEAAPPPVPYSPICRCGTPAVYVERGQRWWCAQPRRDEAGVPAGCDFELRAELERPEPELVSHASIEVENARSTAALLTAAAYGPLADWACTAPSDCGLGLFARTNLQRGQVVGEYGGPRVPEKRKLQGQFLLQVPETHVIIDGNCENAPLCADDERYVVVYANHDGARPNAELCTWSTAEESARLGAVERKLVVKKRMWLVTTEPVAAGGEIRFNYSAGALDYWNGAEPASSEWRRARATWAAALPAPIREPAIHLPGGEEGERAKAGMIAEQILLDGAYSPGAPQLGGPRHVQLPWHGATGGDARLRWLASVGLIEAADTGAGAETATSRRKWAMVSTHLPGLLGSECRARWAVLQAADAAEAAGRGAASRGAAAAGEPAVVAPSHSKKSARRSDGGATAPRPAAQRGQRDGATTRKPGHDDSEEDIAEVDRSVWQAAQDKKQRREAAAPAPTPASGSAPAAASAAAPASALKSASAAPAAAPAAAPRAKNDADDKVKRQLRCVFPRGMACGMHLYVRTKPDCGGGWMLLKLPMGTAVGSVMSLTVPVERAKAGPDDGIKREGACSSALNPAHQDKLLIEPAEPAANFTPGTMRKGRDGRSWRCLEVPASTCKKNRSYKLWHMPLQQANGGP